MNKVTKTCRVCGKTYEACYTLRTTNVFRWQDVSCSPECGSEYLRRILDSRSKDFNDHLVDSVQANEACYRVEGESEENHEFGSENLAQ